MTDIYDHLEQVEYSLLYERISHGLTRGILLCARQPEPAGEAVAMPELTSKVVNDACWKFVEAMPYSLPGPIWNALKPGLYESLKLFNEHMRTHPPAAAPAPAVPQGWTDDQVISFASMILLQGNRSDSIEIRLQQFREHEKLRGNSTPAAPALVPSKLVEVNDIGLVPVTINPFTPAQRRRLWENSKEHHKDAASFTGFERIVTLTERAHGIGQPVGGEG